MTAQHSPQSPNESCGITSHDLKGGQVITGGYHIYFDYTPRNQLWHIYGGVNAPLVKFEYDASGNLTRRRGEHIFNWTRLEYDDLNRVSLCQQAGAWGGAFRL